MASQIVTGSAPINIAFQQTLTSGYLANVSPPVNIPIPMSLACFLQSAGTGANQVNQGTGIRLSLAASPQTIDLTSLTDLDGNAFSLARVKLLAFRHNGKTDTQDAAIGGGSNAFTAFFTGLTVKPGTSGNGQGANNDGFTVFCAPNATAAVVDATHKLIVVDPGAHTFTMDIVILGCDT